MDPSGDSDGDDFVQAHSSSVDPGHAAGYELATSSTIEALADPECVLVNDSSVWGAVCAKTTSNHLIYKQHVSYNNNTNHL